MKTTLIIALFISIVSCESGNTDEIKSTEDSTEVVNQSFEEQTKREIEGRLQIPANEKYTFKIYKSLINSDTIQDAIIAVNRLEFAMNEAIKNGKEVKSAELGFMGNYNYFIYYDGANERYSVPIPIPSTPGRPLDVEFMPITSPTRNDVMIGYRIRNSGWKAYFSVFNEADLLLVFRWNTFDKAGEKEPIALLHQLTESKAGIGNDIEIYESEIDNYLPSQVTDYNTYVPSITKKKKLLYRFFFDQKFGKFRLYNDGPGSELARQKGIL